jgi:hypothetical protein
LGIFIPAVLGNFILALTALDLHLTAFSPLHSRFAVYPRLGMTPLHREMLPAVNRVLRISGDNRCRLCYDVWTFRTERTALAPAGHTSS